MPERSTITKVTFQHPFSLRELDGPHPAGTYSVETVDTTLDTLSFLAWRRVSTLIMLPAIGIPSRQRQMILVDPLELDAALTRDAEAQPTPTDANGAHALGR